MNTPSRYASRPFPPYRYVPGLHPHPVAHPQGHSYNADGHHPTAGPLLPPEQWAHSEDYLYGVDLYNHWYWWEAHEAWEGIWQQSDKAGVQGRFLQGLIQISAAQLKRHMEQAEGVRRLLTRAHEHLGFVLSQIAPDNVYMGLPLSRFLDSVDAWFGERTAQYPLIHLNGGQARNRDLAS